MKKRLISLLLVGTMVTALFGGCGTEKEVQQKEESGSVSGGAEKSDDTEQEVALEPVTIKIMGQELAGFEPQTKWEEYPVGQKLIEDLKEIGIELDIEWVPMDNFLNVLNTRMAAGVDTPDLVSYGWYGTDAIVEWGKSGLVSPVNELLEKYDEDGSIRAFYDEYAPGAWESVTAGDGNNYWFSYLAAMADDVDSATGVECTSAGIHTWYIRRDWVEAVGEEVKEMYTLDEFTDLMKKMHDEDANGNGISDELIYFNISESCFEPLFGLNSSYMCGYGSNGEFGANIYNENFSSYIKYLNSLVEYGLWDSMMLTSTVQELASMDRVAAYSTYHRVDSDYDSYLPFYDENDSVTSYYVPIIIDDDGDLSNGYPMLTDSSGVTSYTPYFVPSASENQEAVVRLMDYIYTKEYAILDQFGLEGKDAGYIKDENGNIVLTGITGSDKAESLNKIAVTWLALPAFLSVIPKVQDVKNEADATNRPKLQWYYELNYKLRSDYYYKSLENGTINYRIPSYAGSTNEEAAILSAKAAELETYMLELLTDMILGRKSIDGLADYQKELEELGYKEYIEVFEAKYNRLAGK